MVAYTFYETDNRVRRYAEALARRGAEVDAIVLRREGQQRFEISRGVRVKRIQRRTINEKGPLSYLAKLLMFFLRTFWVLTVLHLKRPYDIIHVHSVPDFQVFATIIPWLMGARIILDIHDIVPEFYASKFNVSSRSLSFRILLLVEKLSAAYAHHVIIANDLWYHRLVQRSVAKDKCTAIINFPDTSIFSNHPRRVTHGGDFVICYPGTLNSHQGVDLALMAVAILCRKGLNLKLVIIGDGPDRNKLKAMITELGLENRVTLIGFVPMEQVAETMAETDVGVVPKRNDSFGDEAFSTKTMEFMAMGVPVIAARTRIDQYYFSDDLVQFFEPNNADDLAAKLLLLIENRELRGKLSARASEFIRHNNWEVKQNDYFSLLDRLMEQNGGPDGHKRRASGSAGGVPTPPDALGKAGIGQGRGLRGWR
jgi:glycosyltransferase involved in cell wall biosynthesis